MIKKTEGKKILIHPMDKSSVSKLLYLEESNTKMNNDKTVISMLVGYYAQLIEYYDTLRDPMKMYFIEKMQAIMFSISKSSLEDLEKDQTQKNYELIKRVKKRNFKNTIKRIEDNKNL